MWLARQWPLLVTNSAVRALHPVREPDYMAASLKNTVLLGGVIPVRTVLQGPAKRAGSGLKLLLP